MLSPAGRLITAQYSNLKIHVAILQPFAMLIIPNFTCPLKWQTY